MSLEWEKEFIRVLDKHALIRQRKVRNSYAPYIDKELKHKMFMRDFDKKRFSKTKNTDDWKFYRDFRNTANVEKRKKKKAFYSHKLDESKNDIKSTWKLLNMAIGTKSKTTKINSLTINGKILKDPKEIADKLNQYFCTTAKRVQEETFTRDDDIPSFDFYLTKVSKIERPFKFKRITSKDIVDAIAKLKNSRSGNIPTRIFKDSSKYIAPSLAVLFNKSITEGIFPDNLKISRISAIYKGKGTWSNPDHYRPISVLSVIARLFEKLVHNQLFTFLKTYLSKVQSGFKPGFSTETSLLNTTNQWIINIDKGCYNLVLLLDLRKAFDTVDLQILTKKLEFYGVRNTELAWFKSYLFNRRQYCSIAGQDSDLQVNPTGIPQGSCLGPLLCLIYMNELPNILENSDCSLYADDTSLTNTDRELNIAQRKLNNDLDTLGKWISANKLSANLIKTEYMIIVTSAKLNTLDYSPIIELNGKPIARATETPGLGLIVDETLTWEPYVQHLSTKMASAISAIKQANFLPKKSLVTLYQSLVESRLRYCNTVWGNCGETLKNKLQRLQDRAAQVVTKTKYGSIEPDVLFQELGWLNVQQLIDLDTAAMLHKAVHKTAPPYLSELFQKTNTVHSHDTRGATYGLFPKHSNLKFGQRSFAGYGFKV